MELSKRKTEEVAEHALSLLKSKKGWSIRVWENLGWHFSLEKKGMSVYARTDAFSIITTYHCLFSNDGRGGGDVFWDCDNYSTDPNESIKIQIKEARKHIAKCERALRGFSVFERGPK